MFIYPDSDGPRVGPPPNLNNVNATMQYLKHYDNSLILTLFHKEGTALEKLQAAKELAICDRKMQFWRGRPNFCQTQATAGIDKLKAQWGKRL